MTFSSIKDINRLLSKRMSYAYLKVTKLTFPKLRFSQNFDLKSSSPGQFLGAPALADTIKFSNFLLQFKNQRSRSKSVCGLSIILISKGIVRV